MTQQGYRHRLLVVDRSGSIKNILEGQQSGLTDEFFPSEEKVEGKATYSLWDFDSEIRCLYSFASLSKVRGYKIEPRGMTAMLAAIGTAVSAERAWIAGLPQAKRPEDVTVIISSDGLENSWQQWSAAEVKELLETVQQDPQGKEPAHVKWRVLFMGCNQDAVKEGERIGTRGGLTVNTVSTNEGSRNAWRGMSNYITSAPVASASAGGYVMDHESRLIAENKVTDGKESSGD